MEESIAILLTCHNRKEMTKKCLYSIQQDNDYRCDIYLVDDGCTDGTAETISLEFPDVHIIEGDGDLYWNRGMHSAFSEAIKLNYDFYLWINDDVEFFSGIIPKLICTYNAISTNNCISIIVGYTYDIDRTTISYGGLVKKKSIIPLSFVHVIPSEKPQEIDTFHGNCVLIHKSVVKKIGINDPYYQHGFGDSDYGLKAKKNGCACYLTNYPVGICESNNTYKKWFSIENRVSIPEKIRYMNSVTQRPRRDWLYYTKQNGGSLWFIRFILPYIKIFVSPLYVFFIKFQFFYNKRKCTLPP